MAFTKAPTQNTHNVIRIPPFGGHLVPAYNTYSTGTPATCKYYNCYPVRQAQWGTDPLAGVYKRDGWGTTLTTTNNMASANPSRQSASSVLSQNPNYPDVYFAYDATIYRVDYQANVNYIVSGSGLSNWLGTGTNAIGASNTRYVAWLEGSRGAATYLTLINENGTVASTTDLNAILAQGSKGLVFINGYLFCTNTTGDRIYNSGAAGALTTWATTDFLDAEQYADQIIFLAKHHNYLVAFGGQSVEFFYDAGIENGSPLARQESYSRRIGLFPQISNNFISRQCVVAEHGDDLYFCGVNESNTIGFYRIRNFQVEQLCVNDEFVRKTLNAPSKKVVQLCRWWMNGKPCVLIETSDSSTTLAYVIEEDTMVQVTGSDIPTTSGSLLGIPFVSPFDGPSSTTNRAMFLTGGNGEYPTVHYPSTSVSVTAILDFPPQDHGINRWKHLARVDAIGDFGNNTVTLGYNLSPRLGTGSYTSLTTKTPSTLGYDHPVSWFNIGSAHTYQMRLTWAGTEYGWVRGLDIEYDIGLD